MRHKRKIMMCVIVVMAHTVAMAQTSIKKAFDKLIKSSGVEITARHSLEKDPETGKKNSQCDIYEFVMPKSKSSLLKDIERAFENDRDNAYSTSSGVSSRKKGAVPQVSLAVGDGTGSSVSLGVGSGINYIYSCFLDPEDELRIYRYAYAMDWNEEKNVIAGKLVVTYAMTLKSRQAASGNGRVINIGNGRVLNITDNVDMASGSDTSWLGMFNIYAQKLKDAQRQNLSSASVYVNMIYDQCKRAKDLTAVEKNLVSNEIDGLIKIVKDDFQKKLLEAARSRVME